MFPAMFPSRVIVESNELMDTNALWKTEDNIFRKYFWISYFFLFIYFSYMKDLFFLLSTLFS